MLSNFLTSGHNFSANENLQKFRYSFINLLMLMATTLTFFNYLASIFGVIDFGDVFENVTLFYVLVSFFGFYLLRKNRRFYFWVVIFFIATSILLFYSVLLTRVEDEFRLVAFFLGLFITYVLLGKNYGLWLAFLIIISIAVLNRYNNLEISSFALSTFFTFFIIFTVFLYLFLNKVEQDSTEFKLLNNRLKEKVVQEIKQREEQEQMLLRQCRMANMGEMLDSIAHQWRQPLMHINSILMNMDNALETKHKDQGYLENKINEVASLTTHMSQTIEDFRGLFKEDKDFSHFTLQSVVDDVLVLMKNNVREIEIDFNREFDASVLGHRSELMQVIIIIIGNAAEVLNHRNIEQKKIVIDISLSSKTTISFEDNAGGIKQENLEIIFAPYFTTKEQLGGTGLGLYISKIIIENKMSGKLLVSNTPQGAKFTIHFDKGVDSKKV